MCLSKSPDTLLSTFSNLSNASSLLYHALRSVNGPIAAVNWCGFYFLNPLNPQELILGPFQGHVACQSIRLGKGVCGTAAATQKTQVVPNVDEFPGHIACDSNSKSEIVVPIIQNGKVEFLRPLFLAWKCERKT